MCSRKKFLPTSGLLKKIHAPKNFHPPLVISNGPSLRNIALLYKNNKNKQKKRRRLFPFTFQCFLETVVLKDFLVSHGTPCRLLNVFCGPWHWTAYFHAVYGKRHGTNAKSQCYEKRIVSINTRPGETDITVTFLPLAVFLQQFEAAPRDSSSKTYSRFFSFSSYNKQNCWDQGRSVLKLAFVIGNISAARWWLGKGEEPISLPRLDRNFSSLHPNKKCCYAGYLNLRSCFHKMQRNLTTPLSRGHFLKIIEWSLNT